jgi:Predicted redox protein, regulator of disulfide bond formation
MKDLISLKWLDGMAFESELNGHTIRIDASKENGGNETGPRPKALILVSLAGCTAMDVVSILKKMRMSYDSFTVDVESNKSDEHPVVYTDFKIVYRFKGKELDREKIEKAVSLSQERYCGVSAMCQNIGPVSYEIVLE